VIKYDATRLYHLGTRSNLTGEESEVDIGIEKPASYPLTSLEECLRTAATLNRGTESDEITGEGFHAALNRQRIEVASLLREGRSYLEVTGATGASSTTVSRVSKCLNGEPGGYRLVLDRLAP
jgi:TrpR-related protein YerC/YecD